MKKLIAAAVVALVVVGVYFGLVQYEQHKLMESLAPHIKQASVRIANATRYEVDTKTKITIGEHQNKLEEDIDEIDKRVLEVQMIASSKNKNVTEPALAYLLSGQELLRTMLAIVRKHVALLAAFDVMSKADHEVAAATDYSAKLAARQASDQAYNQVRKAFQEYDASTATAPAATASFESTYANATLHLSADVLVDPAIVLRIKTWSTGPIETAEIAVVRGLMGVSNKKP